MQLLKTINRLKMRVTCNGLVQPYLTYWIILIGCIFSTTESNCPMNCTCKETRFMCSKKRLISIPSGWNVSRVADVDLSGNFLGAIRTLSFYSAIRLNLNNNSITTIDDGSFYNTTSLEILNLGFNKISALNSETFIGLEKLKYLNLSSNRLTSIEHSTFRHLVSLEVLDLSKNGIRSIVESAFTYMRKMLKLNLSFNSLYRIERDWFNDNSTVTKLDISNNVIYHLHGEPLAQMRHLVFLNLAHNHLIGITNDVFRYQDKLQYLYLSHNSLYNIEEGSFETIRRSLVKITLNNNLLSFLPEADMLAWKRLKVLTLSGNEWKCECKMLWMLTVLPNKTLSNLTCSSPERMARTSFKYLNSSICPHQNHVAIFTGITLAVIAIIITCGVIVVVKKRRSNLKMRRSTSLRLRTVQYQKHQDNQDEFTSAYSQDSLI